MATVGYRLCACSEAFERRVESWKESGLVHRLWAKDTTLWSEEPVAELGDRLGWLHLPAQMRLLLAALEDFADSVRDSGIEHVLLLGMGGSSLAPEIFQRVFGEKDGRPRLQVLDSTHPAAVGSVLDDLDAERTLVIVSSKSGTTLETEALRKTLWHLMVERLGGEEAGQHFVAITDPGTALEVTAREHGYLQIFGAPTEVGGRFSALSVFGLVPAALIGAPVSRLGGSAQEMAVACAQIEDNPGLELGAAIGELAAAGRDKLLLLTSPSLRSFPDWLEQLVAESTGKNGRGILPVSVEADQLLSGVDGPGDPRLEDRVVIHVALRSELEPRVGELLESLLEAGCPVIDIVLDDVAELGAELFRWEMATGVSAIILGVNPFDQPDVGLAKRYAAATLSGELSLEPGSILAQDDAPAMLGKLLDEAGPGEYVAIQAFLEPDNEIREALNQLRALVASATGLAVTSGFGPRFLHSTGQLHKGGPSKGRFIQLRDQPEPSLDVPGGDHAFEQLIIAQADGDLKALQERGRPAVAIDLGPEAMTGLRRLIETLGKR